jgi:hypothetical protein
MSVSLFLFSKAFICFGFRSLARLLSSNNIINYTKNHEAREEVFDDSDAHVLFSVNVLFNSHVLLRELAQVISREIVNLLLQYTNSVFDLLSGLRLPEFFLLVLNISDFLHNVV